MRDNRAVSPGERTAPGDLPQYTRNREKGKSINLKEMVEELKQLPPITQVVLVLFALVLLAFVPTLGTSILAFLVALKALTTR